MAETTKKKKNGKKTAIILRQLQRAVHLSG